MEKNKTVILFQSHTFFLQASQNIPILFLWKNVIIQYKFFAAKNIIQTRIRVMFQFLGS